MGCFSFKTNVYNGKQNLVQSICSTNSCHRQLGKNCSKLSVNMPQWQLQLGVLKEEKYEAFTMLKNSRSSPARIHWRFCDQSTSLFISQSLPRVQFRRWEQSDLSFSNDLELMRVMSKKVAQWEILCCHSSRKWGWRPTVCWAGACIPASPQLPLEWLLALGHTHPLPSLSTLLVLQVFEFLTLREVGNQH